MPGRVYSILDELMEGFYSDDDSAVDSAIEHYNTTVSNMRKTGTPTFRYVAWPRLIPQEYAIAIGAGELDTPADRFGFAIKTWVPSGLTACDMRDFVVGLHQFGDPLLDSLSFDEEL